MLLARRTAVLLLASLLAVGSATAQPDAIDGWRDALDELTGSWTGSFVVYQSDGTVADSLVTEHNYRWDGDVQIDTFTDRYPDGRVVQKTARNYVRNDTLYCDVDGPDGTTRLIGRVVGDAVVWHRTTGDGGTESYRERVVQTPNGRAYHIDGAGSYPSDRGTSLLLFVGRYRADTP